MNPLLLLIPKLLVIFLVVLGFGIFYSVYKKKGEAGLQLLFKKTLRKPTQPADYIKQKDALTDMKAIEKKKMIEETKKITKEKFFAPLDKIKGKLRFYFLLPKEKLEEFKQTLEEKKEIANKLKEIINEIKNSMEEEIKSMEEEYKKYEEYRKVMKAMNLAKKEFVVVAAIESESKMSIFTVPVAEASKMGLVSPEKAVVVVKNPLPPGEYPLEFVARNVVDVEVEDEELVAKHRDALSRLLGFREYMPLSLSKAYRELKFSIALTKNIISTVYSMGKGLRYLMTPEEPSDWNAFFAKYGKYLITIAAMIMVLIIVLISGGGGIFKAFAPSQPATPKPVAKPAPSPTVTVPPPKVNNTTTPIKEKVVVIKKQ